MSTDLLERIQKIDIKYLKSLFIYYSKTILLALLFTDIFEYIGKTGMKHLKLQFLYSSKDIPLATSYFSQPKLEGDHRPNGADIET